MLMVRANFEFEMFVMPDGAPHCKLKEKIVGPVSIDCSITSFNDLGELLVLVSAIRANTSDVPLYISLFLRYFPGRQDRVQPGFPFTLKVYADIINSMNLDEVYIFHPHSEVSEKMITNSEVVMPDYTEIIKSINPDVIIAPDKGASVWIEELVKNAGSTIPIVLCEKTRDSLTGTLSNPIVHGDVKDKNCLIIDDICDGGGTFILLGNELKKLGAKDLHLSVTHGIFSKGYKELNKVFTSINSFDSFRQKKEYCLEVWDDAVKVHFTKIDNPITRAVM